MAELSSLKSMLDIAKEFGISEDDIPKVSTVGYATRVMSDYLDIISLGILDDKKQKFITTASKMSALYKHAIKNSIEPDKAKGSTVPINLFVYLEDLESAEVVDIDSSKKQLTISDVQFKLGVQTFRLDYPIIVSTYISNGVKKYYAKYDMSSKNPVSDILSNNIPVRKYVMNNKDCLLLDINIRDYTIFSAELGYIDAISSAAFNVAFKNYVQHIQCMYKDTSSDEYRNIDVRMFFDKAIENETIFYIIKDSVITFNNKYRTGKFIPKAGGRFKFLIYTTLANTFEEFTGDTNILLGDDANYSLDFIVTGGASGGRTPLSKEELRNLIKQKTSTNNCLISGNDVETYLNSIGNDDSVYNAYKYIDNFYDRIYNTVIRLGAGNNIVPTNTCDLQIHEDYCLKYMNGRLLTFNVDQEFIAVKDDLDYIKVISKSQFLNDPAYKDVDKNDVLSYALPFQVCYDRKYNLVTIYEKAVNRVGNLEYTYTRDSADTFASNALNFKYNIDYDEVNEYYELAYNLSPNNEDLLNTIHKTQKDSTGATILIDNEIMKAVIIFVEGTTTKGYMTSSISAYKESDKLYNMKTYLRMNSPVYFDKLDVTMYDVNHEVSEMALDMNKCIPKIVVYLKESGYVDNTDQTVYPKFDDYKIMNVFSVLNKDDKEATGLLFKELTSYLPTQINHKETNMQVDTASNPYGIMKSIILDKVPLVRFDYYENNQIYVQNRIDAELAILDDVSPRIEDLFKLRFNFINAYGFSSRLRIGLDGKKLSTSHINMEIRVRKTSTSTLTKDTITEFINNYFSEIAFNSGESFHFSELADAIKAEYADLVFIELVHINNYKTDNQYIYMVDYDNVQFIPEVPNISEIEVTFV